MSNTLFKMLMGGCGYRTEAYSGSGERSLYAVVRHEISMGNTDIVVYLQANSNILLDYTAQCADEMADMCQANAPYIAEEIVDFVRRKLGGQSLCALWLTSRDNVVKLYNDGNTDSIDRYDLPQNYVILSDLGDDGVLFAYVADAALLKQAA